MQAPGEMKSYVLVELQEVMLMLQHLLVLVTVLPT